jgi:GNAT superfamily N-acetyltransferase
MICISAARDLKEFIELPFRLYDGNAHYVASLRRDAKNLLANNPFWLHAERELFIASRGGKAVGRVAAIINKNHNEHWSDKTGFFGFFECENDRQSALALIQAAKNWLKEKGMYSIRGPVNPDTNNTCGVLLNGFDADPMIMMPYNPPYYAPLLESAGLKKAKDLLAFKRTDKDCFSPRMEKIIARVLKNDKIALRRINLNALKNEIEIICEIYNAAWDKNWGFAPITKDEMQAMAKQLKIILRPELTCVLECEGAPAGFALCIPNMNRVLKILNGGLNIFKLPQAMLEWRKIKDFRMVMLGVHPRYRNKGFELLLVKRVVDEAIKRGWNEAELSWILEDNAGIISTVRESGCKLSKKYRVFESVL